MSHAMQDDQRSARAAAFAATDWSMIAAAAQTGSPEAHGAMARLCSAYRVPLYAYLRRKGHAAHDAEDLLQMFFVERVLNRRVLVNVRPGAGRFRSWLLTCLRNWVSNELALVKHQQHKACVPLELVDAESVYASGLARAPDAENAYDRAWVTALLARVRAELRDAYQARERSAWFAEIEGHLPGAGHAREYDQIAARLGEHPSRVRTEVHRLLRRCGERVYAEVSGARLYAEVRRTVTSADEAKRELEYLLGLIE